MVGKTWNMHKRAFQALKRTFMHVSCLPHHILIIILIHKVFSFLSKYGGGRPETCINVRFRSWNARLCLFQVFPYHILIIKLIYKTFSFIFKIWWGKTWNMHTRAFRGLKRTFMHVSGLPHHILIIKPKILYISFFYQNMVGEDVRHA